MVLFPLLFLSLLSLFSHAIFIYFYFYFIFFVLTAGGWWWCLFVRSVALSRAITLQLLAQPITASGADRPSKSLVAQSLDTFHHSQETGACVLDVYFSALDPSRFFWELLKCEPPSRLAAGTLLATAHPRSPYP